jgi:DNA repair protein RadA/Sms
VKHGFKRAIVPFANAPKQQNDSMIIEPVKYLREVLEKM